MTTGAEKTQLQSIEDKVDSIVSLLLGDVDKPENPGLVERMRNVERFIGGMNRLKWLLIGTIVASVGTLAFSLITGR